MDKASEAGKSAALELAGSQHPDTLTIEHTLLDVRERENRLRTTGHADMADNFIDAFLATLDSVNPSLASQLH